MSLCPGIGWEGGVESRESINQSINHEGCGCVGDDEEQTEDGLGGVGVCQGVGLWQPRPQRGVRGARGSRIINGIISGECVCISHHSSQYICLIEASRFDLRGGLHVTKGGGVTQDCPSVPLTCAIDGEREWCVCGGMRRVNPFKMKSIPRSPTQRLRSASAMSRAPDPSPLPIPSHGDVNSRSAHTPDIPPNRWSPFDEQGIACRCNEIE